MTRKRKYGEGTPFGDWFRAQKSLDSHQHGFTTNDADYFMQKYRTDIDRVGTREVQLLMVVEVKTFGKKPDFQQAETLFFHHQILKSKKKLKRIGRSDVMVWHFGCFVLSLSGVLPVEGQPFEWGRFNDDGSIHYKQSTSVSHMLEVLGFIRRPDDPDIFLSLRRHHKTGHILARQKTPLGFKVDAIEIKRS